MRNKATKKNMDLDLRRYGNNLYSKAEQSGGSGGSSGELTKMEMLMELFNNLKTSGFPVTPKKAFKGSMQEYAIWNSGLEPVYIDFLDASTNNTFAFFPDAETEAEVAASFVDIEDATDDFFDIEGDRAQITFLYDLDDLSQLQNGADYPVMCFLQYEGDMPGVYTYQSRVSDSCTNVLFVGDKKYVWFQDWD